MTDELVGTPAPEGEPAPQPQTPAPEGTPEDVAAVKARLEEKEKFIGRQTNEIGDLRNQLSYFQTLVEGLQAARPTAPVREPAEPLPTGTPPDFYDRPMDYVKREVGQSLRAFQEQQQRVEAERRASEAQTNFYEGKDRAYSGNRRLYEGIEKEVESAVYNSYKSGILHERSLANPKTWERAAQLIHLEHNDYDRLTPPKPRPVSATQTETPSGRPMQYGDVPVVIDDETRRWGRGQGLSDKQIEELITKEAVARRQGQNISRKGYEV